MNRNGIGILALALGGLLVLEGPSRAQDLPPEDSKGGRVVTNENASREEGGMQSGRAQPGASEDEILRQMGAVPEGSGATQVEPEDSPALLPEGEFEAGRDIFENIFNRRPEEGPVAEGLPGMRLEEVSLSGVMTGAFGTVALFVGKDQQIYAARENQKFHNGRLAQIQKDKVVFEQEVIDEFGKKRPPIIREVPLHTARPKVKVKGRDQ